MHRVSSSESSSDDTVSRYHYDKAIEQSLADNMYNLSVETEQDDDDYDLTPSPSSRPPRQPFMLDDYSEEDSDDSTIDHKISKIAGLEHLVVNSPLWYAHVRPHLTVAEREALWNRTPWKEKFCWDDFDETDTVEEAAAPLFKNQYFIEVI